ncbi:ABC transporter periplasmic ligand-binding protein [Rhodoplanes sp. Z2-YC6860]|nr:ABC transporter periplasmic ligand-binding protein [Rhodoplanes sp. Z2-YC6860]
MAPTRPILRLLTKFTYVFAALTMLSMGAFSARAETKIVEGIVSHGALQWPEYIATELGWFKENGVDVDMIVVGGGSAQQLAAGSLNIATSGFPDFIRATNQGAPIKIVMNGTSVPPYGVYSKPAIKKISDLKGKVISIGGTKDVTLIYMSAFLAAGGVKASDVDFHYAKATQDRFAALISGAVDAAILYPPATFRAGAQGFTYLGEIDDHLKGFPFIAYAVNTEWAAKNRAAMLGYVKAYGRAVRWLYDPANKEKAIDFLVKYSKQDRKDTADTYDYFITKLKAISQDGLISEQVYKNMTDGLISLEDMKPPVPPMSKFIDASFVQEAWK